MDRTEGTLGRDNPEEAGSEQLRQEIRGTRRHMDETLDQIGERLRPRHLIEDVLTLFQRSGASDTAGEVGDRLADTTQRLGRNLVRQVRENPIPSLLIGAGLIWWLMESGQEEERTSRTYAEPSEPGVGERLGAAASAARERAGEAAAGARQRVEEAASATGERISQAGEAISSAAGSSWENVKEQGRAAMERGSALGQSAAEYARRGAERTREGWEYSRYKVRQTAHQYPLATGGACLAAGLLAGVLLPRTERENELIGGTSDRLKEQAKATGEEILERGKQVASRTASAAMEKAESHGITADSLVEKAANVVSAAAQAGREAAQREGIAPEQLKESSKDIAQTAAETAKEEARKETESAGAAPAGL